MLFSDESHFNVQSQCSQHVLVKSSLHVTWIRLNGLGTKRKDVLGLFQLPLHWISVEGMMNSNRYIDVLKKTIFSDMGQVFPNESGIFQQHLASCHTSKVVTKFLKDSHKKVLD